MAAKFITPGDAALLVRRGDRLGISAMITQVNPVNLTLALAERFRDTGEPGELRLFCPGCYGGWTAGSPCETLVRSGAVRAVTMGFYSAAPDTARAVLDGVIEGYNLPYGVMCRQLRAAAAGQPFLLSRVGQGLFLEPEQGGSRLNALSRDEWLESVTVDGAPFLKYRTPRLDVALLRGTGADAYGNITFERESAVCQARELAQAVHNQGGVVVAEVARRTAEKLPPWDVVVPGCLVDYICVCPDASGAPEAGPLYRGEVFVPPERLGEHLRDYDGTQAQSLVCRRAAEELRPGQIANIGVGMPEGVGVEAARRGLLSRIALTVETGQYGGLPAPNAFFGSAVGAMCMTGDASIFDFFEGGGLDVTFIGALEIDGQGNVNAHHIPGRLAGIGGLADITFSTRKVVFCATFTAGGLETELRDGRLRILREGRYRKFVERVGSVSFSAENARRRGQEVLYVTERCVFRLGPAGLELTELTPGVALQEQVLARLPFTPKLALPPDLPPESKKGKNISFSG